MRVKASRVSERVQLFSTVCPLQCNRSDRKAGFAIDKRLIDAFQRVERRLCCTRNARAVLPFKTDAREVLWGTFRRAVVYPQGENLSNPQRGKTYKSVWGRWSRSKERNVGSLSLTSPRELWTKHLRTACDCESRALKRLCIAARDELSSRN